jgi:hypothetical protein
MKDGSFTLYGKMGLVVTKHGKESVIMPELAAIPGITLKHFECDTDKLGTFSGEIPRSTSAVEAARTKCQWALDSGSIDFAVASEGSFGPHPELLAIPVHHELLLLKDLTSGKEWIEQVTSTDTNYSQMHIVSLNELLDFAGRIGFPEHGIILSTSNQPSTILKDATSVDELVQQFNQFSGHEAPMLAQTDMRAHRNPNRMKIIGQLAKRLATRMNTPCPACHEVGFGYSSARPGAPCRACNYPSAFPLHHVHECVHCGHQSIIELLEQNRKIEPQYCQICNP